MRDKAIYGAYISVLSNLEERVDFRNDTESLAAQCKEYEKELERLRKENEQQKEELYKTEKALADKNTLLEKQANKRSVEKQELNDLRELIFCSDQRCRGGEVQPEAEYCVPVPYPEEAYRIRRASDMAESYQADVAGCQVHRRRSE